MNIQQIMSCLNFICENDAREKEVEQDQTKNLYIQSHKKMAIPYSNHNNSKFKDDRKSLRRSVTPLNSNIFQFVPSYSNNFNIQKPNYPYNRPLSNPPQQIQNIISPTLRYSQPQLPNYISNTNQANIHHLAYPIPPRPQQNQRAQNNLINVNNNNGVNKNYLNFNYPNNQNYANKQANKPQSSVLTPANFQNYHAPMPEKELVHYANNPNFHGFQEANRNEIKISQKQKQDKIKQQRCRQENFLKPIEEFEPGASRSGTNVYNIDDIACTKTQSVGSSSESSSSFSEIVYRANNAQSKQKQLTNSSINFVTDEGKKEQNSENIKGHKIKKSETAIRKNKDY